MKKLLTLVIVGIATNASIAQNQLAIPPTLSQSNINLTLDESTHQFYPGINTSTMGANGDLLGPTLILHKDSSYNFSVENLLTDTTTMHWHGLHVAPENDGGPHTIILPNETWTPSFTIMDRAGTFWYHPHLHMKTGKHVSKGIAGLLLVRDAEEATLNIPLTYGVDEFPIVLQTKGFDVNTQIEVHTDVDSVPMVNGTLDAIVDFPAQVVRLRVLNGSSQRVMEFGFSNNKSFSLIGTDGGIFNSPVSLTRYRIAPGQRADILVDLTSDLGQNLQLMSYGSELPNATYGAAQPGMAAFMTIPDYDLNPLNGTNFQLLDITVVAQTANPIISIPASLVNYTPIPEAQATVTRNLTFTSDGGMGNLQGPFLINGVSMDASVINYTVALGTTEIWELRNQTPIAHPFHIHDVQFYILDINGTPPPAHLQGLNDVVLVPGGQGTVRFIAVFEDFTNPVIPYMYHCHMLPHEDAGMMGQFVVIDDSGITGKDIDNLISVFPNPSQNGNFKLDLSKIGNSEFEFFVYDAQGRSIDFLSKTDSNLLEIIINKPLGIYFITIKTATQSITKKLIIK